MPIKAADIKRLLTEPGKHPDGGGLYLFVRPSGKGSWVVQYRFAGKTHWAVLGPEALLTLAEARQKHRAIQLAVFNKTDPRGKVIPEPAKATGKTFTEALAIYLAAKAPNWAASNRDRNLRRHAMLFEKIPDFAALRLSAIDQDAKNLALSIWNGKARDRRNVSEYIEAVIKYAKTGKLRIIGPAVEGKHHAEMPYASVPAFYRQLPDTVEANALRFLILTGARTDEVVGAKTKGKWTKQPANWGEIEGSTWVVPANRMKGKRTHHVPLSPQMVALIGPRQADDVPLFKLTDVANGVRYALRETEKIATVHGFRTSFSNWGIENTNAGPDLIDMCISHLTRDKVREAYQRSPQLEQRRAIFEQWSDFVAPAPVI